MITPPSLKVRLTRRSAILFGSLLFAATLPSALASTASLKLVQKQLDKLPPQYDTVADAGETALVNAIELAVKAQKAKAPDILATVLGARDDATELIPTLLSATINGAGGSNLGASPFAKIVVGAIEATPNAIAEITISALQFPQASGDAEAFTFNVVTSMDDGATIGSFVAQMIASGLEPGKTAKGFTMAVITQINYKAYLAKKDDSYRVGAVVGGGVSTMATDAARLELTQTALNLLATEKNKIALNIALFSTPFASNPTTFAAKLAEGRAASLQEQIAQGAVQATAQNPNIATAIIGAILSQDATDSHQIIDKASFAAAAVSGVTGNEPLAASLAKVIAAAVHTDPQKAAVAAAIINSLDATLKSNGAEDIASQVATLLDDGNQPNFAQALAALVPNLAGQIAIGVAVTNPARVALITAYVMVANKTTIKNAAAIAAAVVAATNIGAVPEIANAISLQFETNASLAKDAPDIAQALAQSLLAKDDTLKERAIAIADVAAIFASHITEFPAKGAKEAQVLKIIKSVLKINPQSDFSNLVIGNFAKALKTLGASNSFLDKIQKAAFSTIKDAAIREEIRLAIEQVKAGTDPFTPGEINDPETPIVNG